MSKHYPPNVHPEPVDAPTPPQETTKPKKEKTHVRVDTSSLNIRKDPDLKAPVVATVPRGTKMLITKRADEYYGVETVDGHKGYVMRRYVEEV